MQLEPQPGLCPHPYVQALPPSGSEMNQSSATMPTVARGSTPAVNADGTTSRFRRLKGVIQSGARLWTHAGPRTSVAQSCLESSIRVHVPK